MELRQVYTFIQVAQFQSFSKAAEYLGYSQSAVTVQIRLLEQELNARLFDRMGKHIMLTAQGERFMACARRIMYEVNQAKSLMAEDEELHNPLRVGTIESICTAKLPFIVRYFRKHHPRVPIQITTSSPEELIEMMEQNQLDLIYILDAPRWNDKWYKAMDAEERMVFVASPGYKLAGKTGISIANLMGEPFFLTEKNANYRQALDVCLAQRRLNMSELLESSDTAFIITMLEQNDGISFLPYFAVQKYIESGRLCVLDVNDVDITMSRQIFYHKSKFKTREMEAFIQLAIKN